MQESPEVGESAPGIRLPDLKGTNVALEGFKGEAILVLFCSPECGFCQEMLPDLKEWEASPRKVLPNCLSSPDGIVEDNEAMGFGSPVLLDVTYAVWDAFGVGGTPSAVLIDAEGLIASEIVLGEVAVLELLRSGRTAA